MSISPKRNRDRSKKERLKLDQRPSGTEEDIVITEVSGIAETGVRFTFASLVTNIDEYKGMVASFHRKGFTNADCEFIYVDNSRQNRLDAFASYNRFLEVARGRYVVLCHQDVVAIDDDRAHLEALLAELDAKDATWALCGNAGATAEGEIVQRISDPHGTNVRTSGPFPRKVMGLDENFIIARKDTRLALSRDLTGFHMYGADLGVIADLLGYTVYVIDFHLRHNSGGKADQNFWTAVKAFGDKYAQGFRSRWQYGTVTSVYLCGAPLLRLSVRARHSLRNKARAILQGFGLP